MWTFTAYVLASIMAYVIDSSHFESDSNPLPFSEQVYNNLPHFMQTYNNSERIFTISEIGKIFQKHGMIDYFGLILLHKVLYISSY